MWWFFHLWCASFWRPKTVTTLEIIDQIHELILEDRRISAKSIAQQLGVSRERFESIIHENLDTRKLSAKLVPKCLNANQKCHRCQSSEHHLEFFRRDPNDFLSRLMTIDETWLYHYDLETKQQSLEWRHSGSPRPIIFQGKNPLEIFSPRFSGIKTTSSLLIIFQRAKLSARNITHFCWCNWRRSWRKNVAGSSPKRSCSCTTMPRLTGHLQPRRNWPTRASSVLKTHPILRIWPRRTTACSLDWKNNWKVAIFRPTRRSLLPRRPGWTDKFLIFLSGLQKLELRAKKCTELRGEYIE